MLCWKGDLLLSPSETLEPPDDKGFHAIIQADRGHQTTHTRVSGLVGFLVILDIGGKLGLDIIYKQTDTDLLQKVPI